jgi:hypothetical protein
MTPQCAASNESVERGMWPVHDAPDVAMLDRIEMQVVDALRQTSGIANCRLPEAPSPKPTLNISALG